MGWQWHQLGHMQIICTSLQIDNHTSTSPLSLLQAGCPYCRPTNSVKALLIFIHSFWQGVNLHQQSTVTRRPASADNTACCHMLPIGVGPFAFRYQGNGATPLPIYWYHSKGNWLRYNFAADSFYIMKLCSRLLVLYCRNCPKDDKFRKVIPILRKLGAA